MEERYELPLSTETVEMAWIFSGTNPETFGLDDS